MDITKRNETDLGAFVKLLQEQRTRMIDLIVPASKLSAQAGHVKITDGPVEMTADGVTSTSGYYAPTRVADERIAEKLGIHGSMMHKLRDSGRFDIWDALVTGYLQGGSYDDLAGDTHMFDPDQRKFMARLYRGDEEGSVGIIRALLSDKFLRIDNLDVLVTTLDGMRKAGLGQGDIEIKRCDITERNMYVKVAVPQVAALAPKLLEGYRSPWGGQEVRSHSWSIDRALQAAAAEGQGFERGKEPVVFAGFVIRNSETGDGGFSITPELTIKVCMNGLTFTADALSRTHLGGKQSEGIIEFSQETQKKELELVALKTRDAVRQYLNPEYVQRKIAELEADAGVEVEKPADVIKAVTRGSDIPVELEDEILNLFTKGGQTTAGGVMQAVSAAAQTVDDGELAALLEAEAPKALALAARAAR